MYQITTIYYLTKEDGIPFYVGQTTKPHERIKHHKDRFGEDVMMEHLEDVHYYDRIFWEKFYMQLFLSWGFPLINRKVVYEKRTPIRKKHLKPPSPKKPRKERAVEAQERKEYTKQEHSLCQLPKANPEWPISNQEIRYIYLDTTEPTIENVMKMIRQIAQNDMDADELRRQLFRREVFKELKTNSC